jgi:hypothetical protein
MTYFLENNVNLYRTREFCLANPSTLNHYSPFSYFSPSLIDLADDHLTNGFGGVSAHGF